MYFKRGTCAKEKKRNVNLLFSNRRLQFAVVVADIFTIAAFPACREDKRSLF